MGLQVRLILDGQSRQCFKNGNGPAEAVVFLLCQTNAPSSTVSRNELDAGLFKGAAYLLERSRIGLPCTAFKVRNGLGCYFACL